MMLRKQSNLQVVLKFREKLTLVKIEPNILVVVAHGGLAVISRGNNIKFL